MMTRTDDSTSRLDTLHERIAEGVAELAGSEQWAAMLEVAARFPAYSLGNLMLIMAQALAATRVCGFRRWQQLGRQVRKGEKGIKILAPCSYAAPTDPGDQGPGAAPDTVTQDRPARRQLRGFKVAHVFDIGQTDGDPLPEVVLVLLAGDAPEGLWDELVEQVTALHGYTLERGSCGTANGWADGTTRTVRVRDDVDDAQAVKTLAHELAHIECGHTASDSTHERGAAEVTAESVAFVVTAARGMATDAYTLPYVAGWSGGSPDKVRATATTVLATARTILDRLDAVTGPVATRDEIGA